MLNKVFTGIFQRVMYQSSNNLSFVNAALAALLSLMLFAGACANVPLDQSSADGSTATTQAAGPAPSAPPARPKLELTEEILYQLLVAEIAGQRGQLDLAVNNYLELAKSTRDHEIASRATRIAVYARDDKAAYEAAQIWVELDPENSDAHQVLAVMAVRDGDLDTALGHFQVILKNSEGAIDQKLWVIANLLGKEQDLQVVRQVVERLMENHQEDSDALYAYAHVMSRLNDDEKSLEILQKLLTIVPDNINARMSYVSVLQKLGRSNEALTWLEQSLEEHADDHELRMFYARLLTDEKRFDDARRQFEILDQATPQNSDVIYALGLLNLQDNKLDEAQTYFERMDSLGDYPDEAGYYLGRIAEEKGDIDNAITWYRSIQQGSNYFDAQVRLGLLLAKQGNVEEARRHIQGIRAGNQQQKNILVQAEGELLVEEKRYADAMVVYDQALENKYDGDLLYARAMVAEKIGRLDILEQDLRTILEQDPDNAQALNALGYTLADRTDRYQEAYDLIKKALELKPNDYYVLDSMGWVLYRLGRLDEAINYLQQALNERYDPEIAAHLGEVLWVKGDRQTARKVWDAALQQTPDDSRLLDVIKRFIP